MKLIKIYTYLLFFIALHFTSLHAIFFFLEGTCSSGKSSICHLLKQDNEFTIIASLYWDWGVKKLTELFPLEIASIEKAIIQKNMIHALRRNIIIFKKNSTKTQQNNALKAIKKIQNYFTGLSYHEHMKEFKKYSLVKIYESIASHDKFTIIDGCWYLNETDILPNVKTYTILAYCSFGEMIHRIASRNKTAFLEKNIINHRFFKDGMVSFFKFYTLSSTKDNAIDTLDKITVQKYLNFVELQLSNSNHFALDNEYIIQEFTQKEFQSYATNLLQIFQDQDLLYVIPKKHYDLILKTDNIEPRINTLNIVNFVKKFKS